MRPALRGPDADGQPDLRMTDPMETASAPRQPAIPTPAPLTPAARAPAAPPPPGAAALAAMDAGAIPRRYDGPAAWTGAEMRARDEWIVHLGDADQAELDEARRATAHLPIEGIGREDFALPALGPRLLALRDEVLHGRGFVLLRGLDIEGWPIERTARTYWGLGAWFGRAVSQNAMGHVLGHVRDIDYDLRDPNVRTYQTAERQFYHSDSCDIVALLCLQPAKRGGLSSIVSSVTLYNEMARRRPDLAAILSEPVPFDRRGEVPGDEAPFFLNAVFNHHDDLVSSYVTRRYIESSQRHPDAPRLTPAHVEALDLLDALAEDADLHLDMEFRPGDIQLLHNHTVFHDRTAFEDWPEPEHKRHLLRLWLCPPNGRPLPDRYAARWGSVTIGDRGGIVCLGTKLHAPLTPV